MSEHMGREGAVKMSVRTEARANGYIEVRVYAIAPTAAGDVVAADLVANAPSWEAMRYLAQALGQHASSQGSIIIAAPFQAGGKV